MPRFPLADCNVALAGDQGTQVPRYGVTPSEIAVLNAIHGEGSVTDIVLTTAEVERSHREERTRLLQAYARIQDGRDSSVVSVLFPGVAARMFETFEELDLPINDFKTIRAQAELPLTPLEEAIASSEAPKQSAAQSRAAKIAAKAAAAAAKAKQQPVEPVPAGADSEDEGIGDEINDKFSEKDAFA